MSDLFDLSLPWWNFILRALVIYLVVMVLVRVSGKRAVGQLTPFDLVLLILIGNAVQNGMNGGDNSLTGAVILSVSLIALNYLVAWLAARVPAVRRLTEGEPMVLARDGHVFRDVLKREMVSRADFEKAMRESGCDEHDQIKLAVLETDGHITLVMHEESSH